MRALFGEIQKKTFGRINIGDLDKIIFYMYGFGVNFNV